MYWFFMNMTVPWQSGAFQKPIGQPRKTFSKILKIANIFLAWLSYNPKKNITKKKEGFAMHVDYLWWFKDFVPHLVHSQAWKKTDFTN